MENDWRTSSDSGLERLFEDARRELPAEPFTAAVMRPVWRSVRRRRLRACVLGGALAASVALAAGPLLDLLGRVIGFAGALRAGTVGALGTDLLAAMQMYRIPVLVVLLCALAWSALARFVAR